MMENIPFLTLLTFSPLLGIIILAFINRDNAKWLRIVGIATTFIPLILSIFIYSLFNKTNGAAQLSEHFQWLHLPLNVEAIIFQNIGIDPQQIQFLDVSFRSFYSLAVDGFSLPLIILTTFVVAMAALASVHIKSRWKTFYILFLLLEIGILGVFMARDLVMFFIFFEMTLVPMFFLIGIWGYQNKERAANRFLIYNGLGSAIMLFAFLVIIATAGATVDDTITKKFVMEYSSSIDTIANNFSDPTAPVNVANSDGFNTFMSEGMKTTLFVLLFIAFGIKLPIFPFHTWMLKVHAEAPPSVVNNYIIFVTYIFKSNIMSLM